MLRHVLLWALGSVALQAEVQRPEEVRFISTNLKNVLVWRPGEDGTTFSVEYATYGDENKLNPGHVVWKAVRRCSNVTQNSCDLSDETNNIDEEYYGRVKAIKGLRSDSEWVKTTRFYPRLDTTLGPPQVDVTVNGNYLEIEIKGPMRWKNRRMKKDRSMEKTMRQRFTYSLSVYDSNHNEMNIYVTNTSYKLGPLNYETQYCLSAGVNLYWLPIKHLTSERQCVAMHADPFKQQTLTTVLGGFLPSAVSLGAIVLVGYAVYQYVWGNKERLPASTMLSKHGFSLPTFIPEKPLTTINLNINMISQTTGETKYGTGPALVHKVEENVQPVPYAAQNEPGNAGTIERAPLLTQARPAPVDGPLAEDSAGSRQPSDTPGVPFGAVGEKLFQLNERWPSSKDLDVDYGEVHREDCHLPASGVNSYIAQTSENPWEEGMDDSKENGPTVLNWSPCTGVLHIPLLSSLEPKVRLEKDSEEESEQTTLSKSDIFNSLVFRQSSQESGKDEDGLSVMENMWELQINMDE
ncbi:interleukin-20 receptor subunit alpha [Denticeps clupeoides]|uniref:interleukin-20 receptor subunit alpha n=1 Tax=Denticeps clupeoides TaxID=299321 RepID=UPI0010A2CB84|nr:interleukin-20 receptor subunit alpha-like [Denticeps clupeoides]XP_028808873.1 interleukin-20 receptor subunit alpha-like [Denticeps clupeoides]